MFSAEPVLGWFFVSAFVSGFFRGLKWVKMVDNGWFSVILAQNGSNIAQAKLSELKFVSLSSPRLGWRRRLQKVLMP